MNSELWTLVQSEDIETLVEQLVIAERMKLRRFRNVSEVLNAEEPAGGMILIIDSTSGYQNFGQIIKRIEKNFINFEVMVFTEHKDLGEIGRDPSAGVDMFVPVPVEEDDFQVRAAHVISLRRVKNSAGIIGRSAPLREVLETIIHVAPTEVSVLIEGESGSGKELIARAIHARSNRRARDFEAVNCGAMAEGVLESELFGHEKGSFTGAVGRRQGLFERADHGTLLLDEVGEMSLATQVRFLRVLESGEFMRVGGGERQKADVRIISATNRELETAVERGEFRKDLYYRLKVVQINIPPLRARQDDIQLLARHFMKISSEKHGRQVRGIDRSAMDLLRTYTWPGNIRELANVIDNLVVMTGSGTISRADVEKRVRQETQSQSFPDIPVHIGKSRDQMERELIINSLLSLHTDVREILRIIKDEAAPPGAKWRRWVEVEEAGEQSRPGLDELEREAIIDALISCGGNRKKAARQLGLSERTLYRRLKEYGIT